VDASSAVGFGQHQRLLPHAHLRAVERLPVGACALVAIDQQVTRAEHHASPEGCLAIIAEGKGVDGARRPGQRRRGESRCGLPFWRLRRSVRLRSDRGEADQRDAHPLGLDRRHRKEVFDVGCLDIQARERGVERRDDDGSILVVLELQTVGHIRGEHHHVEVVVHPGAEAVFGAARWGRVELGGESHKSQPSIGRVPQEDAGVGLGEEGFVVGREGVVEVAAVARMVESDVGLVAPEEGRPGCLREIRPCPWGQR